MSSLMAALAKAHRKAHTRTVGGKPVPVRATTTKVPAARQEVLGPTMQRRGDEVMVALFGRGIAHFAALKPLCLEAARRVAIASDDMEWAADAVAWQLHKRDHAGVREELLSLHQDPWVIFEAVGKKGFGAYWQVSPRVQALVAELLSIIYGIEPEEEEEERPLVTVQPEPDQLDLFKAVKRKVARKGGTRKTKSGKVAQVKPHTTTVGRGWKKPQSVVVGYGKHLTWRARKILDGAIADWIEGKAYLDNAGNYRQRVEGRSNGVPAMWSKDVKEYYDSHEAFQASADAVAAGRAPAHRTQEKIAKALAKRKVARKGGPRKTKSGKTTTVKMRNRAELQAALGLGEVAKAFQKGRVRQHPRRTAGGKTTLIPEHSTKRTKQAPPTPKRRTKAKVRMSEKGNPIYQYSKRALEKKKREKFERVATFAKALPRMLSRVERDLSESGTPPQKVAAAMTFLIDRAMFRAGSERMAAKHETFGVATLKPEHVEVEGDTVTFKFTGKKQVPWQRVVTEPQLAAFIGHLKANAPGDRLFWAEFEGQGRKPVTAGHLNGYLKQWGITSKDIRTFHATRLMFKELSQRGGEKKLSKVETKKQVKEALEAVAERLGHTPAVCKSSYVMPEVIKAFEQSGGRMKAETAWELRKALNLC